MLNRDLLLRRPPRQLAHSEFVVDPEYVTAPTPKILWIELTSKCPFDCVFCTRRVRFGAGRNLDFEIFRRVIDELEAPEFVGLNYSGESIHYPRLAEAIELAAATGAATEVVTAFSSVSPSVLRAIVESPLDRLAISLHTLDARQYRDIYRFGSLDGLKQSVDAFQKLRSSLGKVKPRLDFCFVAMHDNLEQLGPVAEYARSMGAAEIGIHPIIGRHAVPRDFSRELAQNQLREGFKDDLRRTVASVEAAQPGLTINVLNPALDPNPRLSHSPGYFSPLLPQGTRIYTCDQSPFESVHILATGHAVVCEVLDEVSMGNLAEQPLREIWHGKPYAEFRRRFVTGVNPECRSCVWKQAYLPAPWVSTIEVGDGMTPQLLRGWHSHEGSTIIWSKKQALLALDNPQGKTKIFIAGVLPPEPDSGTNSLRIRCNHVPVGECNNTSKTFQGFEKTFSLPQVWDRLYLELVTAHPYRPSLYGSSGDSRDLGFALERIGLLEAA
jgi:radical SAM protein with 4Fe4S-binding SPASM domain